MLRGVAIMMAVLAAAACNPREIARRYGTVTRLSIATGGTAGVYYPYGGGLAKVISESIPHVQATAEVTAATVDNLKLLQRDQVDIAFALADTLDDAVHGRGPFGEGPVAARALAVLYPNYTHLVTVEGRGITQLADLRGKVISTGAPGSGTEVIAFRVLQAAGIDPARDVRRQGLSAAASVDAIKDGKIDAFFWSGGLPTAALLDLGSTVGMTLVLVPNDGVLESLQERYGASLYSRLTIPAATYPGMRGDVFVIGVANALVVHERMDERLAYDLTRVLFERQAQLIAIHPEAKNLSLETAVAGSPAPFHPGALRYYRERRVAAP